KEDHHATKYPTQMQPKLQSKVCSIQSHKSGTIKHKNDKRNLHSNTSNDRKPHPGSCHSLLLHTALRSLSPSLPVTATYSRKLVIPHRQLPRLKTLKTKKQKG
ncbi:hypothetical protein F2P56_008562, partial [Juglans regia]